MTIQRLFLLFFLAFVWFHQPLIAAEQPDVEVIKYCRNLKVKDGNLIKSESLIIQINNKAGEEYAEFAFPYSQKDKITQLKAWIQDTTGVVIRKLEKNQVHDKSEFSMETFYSDAFIRSFELKHNVYPYQVCYEISRVQKEFFWITDWSPAYNSTIPTQYASLDLTIPLGYEINFRAENMVPLVIDTIDREVHYQWKADYQTLVPDEILASPNHSPVPRVIIVPIRFTYGIPGEQDSWRSFGDYIYELNTQNNQLPQTEMDQVSQLTSGITDTLEKIRRLYHYMQDHTRYINVSIDVGGMKPYPAKYVAENKYGDCKALVNYMKVLLEMANIPSFYCLIRAGRMAEKIKDNFPGQQFNHVILCLPLLHDTVWLECTNKSIPFGYLGPFTQNRTCLFIEKGNSRLINTPKLGMADVTDSRNIVVTTSASEPCKVDISVLSRGDSFIELVSGKSDLTKEDITRYFRFTFPGHKYQVANWTLFQPDRDSSFILLQSVITLFNYPKILSGMLVCDLFPSHLPKFEKTETRKLPVYLPHPICYIDSLEFRIPGHFTVSNPSDIAIENGYGKFSLKFNLMSSSILVVRTVQLFPGEYSLEEYPGFYSFISKIREHERMSKIVFKPEK